MLKYILVLSLTVMLSGCTPVETTDGAPQAFHGFFFALGVINHQYTVPTKTKVLLTRALQGIAADPSEQSSAANQVLQDATARIIAGGDLMLGQIITFNDAINTLHTLPPEPEDTELLQDAATGMADGLDPLTCFVPESVFAVPENPLYPGQFLPDTPNSRVQIFMGTNHSCTTDSAAPALSLTAIQQVRFGDVGYLRIGSFSRQTAFGLQVTFDLLKNGHPQPLTGLILDLRNAHGGSPVWAGPIAGEFLPKLAPIGIIQTRLTKDEQHLAGNSGDITNGLPMVVLVNGQTASTAELIAGALQYNHRSKILGSKTAGSGAVQAAAELPFLGAMYFTIGNAVLPSGRPIQPGGITPDIAWPASDAAPATPGNPASISADPEIQKALNLLSPAGLNYVRVDAYSG